MFFALVHSHTCTLSVMSADKKILLIILDGLADRPLEELGGQTPLEVARTPNLDKFAELSINGLLHPLAPGIPMPTDVAHYLLFGYPLEQRPGRAVFEATGYGVPFSDDEVLCSTSFALVKEEEGALVIEKRRGLGLNPKEGQALCEAVAHFEYRGIKFELIYTARHFGILKMRGPVSDRITDSDPFYSKLPVVAIQPLDDSEEAKRTAEALNHYLRWTYHVLKKKSEKVNILLTKWPARKRPLISFYEKYGMRGLSISAKALLHGLAAYLGMDYQNSEALNPSGEESLKSTLPYAIRALRQYDFVHLHDTRPDAISHKKDPQAKAKLIEQIDAELELLLKSLRGDWVVAITSDHATPSTVGVGKAMHAGEPMPIAIWGVNVLKDNVKRFSEREAQGGGLGFVYGKDLMNILMNYADRLGNYGFRPRRVTEDTASYRPHYIKPLTP